MNFSQILDRIDKMKWEFRLKEQEIRELCKKYNFTILLIHYLNKNNKSLESTAINGSVDGIFTLKLEQNLIQLWKYRFCFKKKWKFNLWKVWKW